MKTLTIEIPDSKTEKLVKDLLAKHGIVTSDSLDKIPLKKPVKKLLKSEREYEDKVDRNLSKMMEAMTPSQLKTVSRDSVMKILRPKK